MLRHERSDALQFIFNLQERELVAQSASCRTGQSEIDWEDNCAHYANLFRPLRIVGLLSDQIHIFHAMFAPMLCSSFCVQAGLL